MTNGSVAIREHVVKKRKGAESIVAVAAYVVGKRPVSAGRIVRAVAVEQHRSSANCGIGNRRGSGEGQRSSANTGVEAGGIG